MTQYGQQEVLNFKKESDNNKTYLIKPFELLARLISMLYVYNVSYVILSIEQIFDIDLANT